MGATSAVLHKVGSQSVLLIVLSGGDSPGVREKYNKTQLNKCRGCGGGITKGHMLYAENSLNLMLSPGAHPLWPAWCI